MKNVQTEWEHLECSSKMLWGRGVASSEQSQ